jgi:hypothetical protein
MAGRMNKSKARRHRQLPPLGPTTAAGRCKLKSARQEGHQAGCRAEASRPTWTDLLCSGSKSCKRRANSPWRSFSRSLDPPPSVVIVWVPIRLMRVGVVTMIVMPPRCDGHEHGVHRDCNRNKECNRLPFGGQVIHGAELCKRRARRPHKTQLRRVSRRYLECPCRCGFCSRTSCREAVALRVTFCPPLVDAFAASF